MRALLLPCFAVLSIAFSGCSAVYSAHPLADGDAVNNPAIEGTWTPANESDDPPLCVENLPDRGYVMVVSDPDTKTMSVYSMALVELDAHLYADVEAKGQLFNGVGFDPQGGTLAPDIIVRLDVGDTNLDWSLLSKDAITEQNRNSTTPLTYIDVDGDMFLSSETGDLRQYVSINADRIFGPQHHYIRKVNADLPDSTKTACGIPTHYLKHSSDT